VNPRYLGIVPEEYKVGTLKGFHWVGDANYVAIPKGVAPEKMGALLQLIAFILKPEQQAFMYDHGYMYPGPATKNVPIGMAPADSQETFKRFGRPEYAAMMANNPIEPPLDAKPLVAMFDKWDREIGAAKMKK